MTFKDKTILVTGGSGFIGSHLCDELIKTKLKKLIIFDNLSASSEKNIEHLLKVKRVEFIKSDFIVRDGFAVDQYVSQSDFVFHLAACNVGNSILDPEYDLETNALGTLNILMAVKERPEIRLIHFSSGSISNPSTPYAISKLAGENYVKFFVKEYGVKASIIRPYHVFGPRQSIDGKCGVVNIFLNKVLQGFKPVIWGKGDAIKCFTYVQDVVNATLLVAEQDDNFGEAYDVASENRVSINELSKVLIERYAEDKSLEPIHIEPKVGENSALHPDTDKIRSLGWQPEFTFEQGLDECKEWVEKQLKK